jgi:hypothetical protein
MCISILILWIDDSNYWDILLITESLTIYTRLITAIYKVLGYLIIYRDALKLYIQNPSYIG